MLPEPATVDAFRRPPGIWSVLLTALITTLLLEDASRQAATNPFLALVAMGCGSVLVVHFAYCLLRDGTPSPHKGRWRWVVVPLSGVLVLSTGCEPWLLRLRFAHSRPAFEVALVEADSQGGFSASRRVGTFRVSSVQKAAGATYFIVGDGLADPVAICFDPSQPKAGWLNIHLGGNWYAREM